MSRMAYDDGGAAVGCDDGVVFVDDGDDGGVDTGDVAEARVPAGTGAALRLPEKCLKIACDMDRSDRRALPVWRVRRWRLV